MRSQRMPLVLLDQLPEDERGCEKREKGVVCKSRWSFKFIQKRCKKNKEKYGSAREKTNQLISNLSERDDKLSLKTELITEIDKWRTKNQNQGMNTLKNRFFPTKTF